MWHCCRNGERQQLLGLKLGHELYLSVEEMYENLNLPAMVAQAVEGFDVDTQRSLLHHIVLTGGNFRINGFAFRLERDLTDTLPAELRNSVRVCDPRLMSGRTDAVIGASYLKRWSHARWTSSYDYVMNGP